LVSTALALSRPLGVAVEPPRTSVLVAKSNVLSYDENPRSPANTGSWLCTPAENRTLPFLFSAL
jgi:hypothetical protein